MSIRGIFKKLGGQYRLNGGGLSFKEKFMIALPGPASVLGSIIIHNTLIKYYTDIIGVNPKYIGWVYFAYSIWNAINDPLFGVYVDRMRYHPKKGKYVYLMRVTAPVMMLSIVGMLFASPSWSDWITLAFLLAALFLFDTAYTFYSIAYQSYFFLIAATTENRVDVDVIRSYVGNAIGFLATLIPTLLLVGDNNRGLIIPCLSAVICINAIILFIALHNLKERPELYTQVEQQTEKHDFKQTWSESVKILKSRPFLTYLLFYVTARGAMGFYFTPFLFYMDDVMEASGPVATVADVVPGLIMLAALPLVGSMIKKMGSKNVLIMSYVPAIIGYLSLMFIHNPWLCVISYTFIVLSLNMCQTAGVSINGALIDDNEQATGVRKTGLFNGLFALFATTLTGLQSIIFTNVISWFGYDENAKVQTARAIFGIRVGTAMVPIVCCLIGLIPLLLFPLGKKREKELSDYSAKMRKAA